MRNSKSIRTVNVVEELSDNREKYKDTDAKLINKTDSDWFPSHLIICFDRLKAQVDPRPSLDATVACCIFHGIEEIQAKASIKGLLQLKEKLKESWYETEEDIEEMFGLQSISPSFIATETIKYRRHKLLEPISVPRPIKKSAQSLAKLLNAPLPAIVAVSSMIVCSTQEETLNGHVELLNKTVSAFFKKIDLRKMAAEALLNQFPPQVRRLPRRDFR